MNRDGLLKALELADNGDWEGAHNTVQEIENEYAYWIHANLHREEGDISNAKYWYRRAGREYIEVDYRVERENIRNDLESRQENKP